MVLDLKDMDTERVLAETIKTMIELEREHECGHGVGRFHKEAGAWVDRQIDGCCQKVTQESQTREKQGKPMVDGRTYGAERGSKQS